MAEEDVNEIILDAFRQVAGGVLPGPGDVPDWRDLVSGATGTQTTATSSQNSTSSQAGSTAASIAKTALSVLSIGISPLVRGILGLFGGSKPKAPEPLVRYALPPSLEFDAANPQGTSAFEALSYGQDGLPRTVRGLGSSVSSALVPESPGNGPAAYPTVNIQVNAMDSRSFLDHSDDIAQAVREAMLNMHSLNDVVSDL